MTELTVYDGAVKGDRLSSLLLFDITKEKNEDSSYLTCPFPISIGLNTIRSYKLALKFHNPLTQPVIFKDFQVLACPIYTQNHIMYYTNEVLDEIPSSSLNLSVHAFTNDITENNELEFKEVDVSNEVEIQQTLKENACYQYIDQETTEEDYDTPFGSLGVYYGDDDNRCLTPVTFNFDNLVVQPESDCYFIFESSEFTNENGGFAIQATEDFRSINIVPEKSGGIFKRLAGIWRHGKMYFRTGSQWVSDELPGCHSNNITTFYPYDKDGQSE